MFYNSPQKTEYLESEDNRFEASTLEVAKRIFAGSAMVEAQEEMDLINFNRNQVVNLLKKYNAKSKGYYKMMCIIFSDYYNWCMEKGYLDQSNFTNWYDSKLSNAIIDEVLPTSLVKDKFFTHEDVLEYLTKVPDVTNKFLIYATFMGIDGENHEDLKYLRVDDLFEKRNAIQLHSGKIQFVNDMFIELLKKADEATRYNPDGNDFDSPRNVYANSMYVFKFCKISKENLPISSSNFTQRMSVIKKQTGNNFISISSLKFNGLIHAIKEHYEKQGISLYTAMYHEINRKLYTHDEETQEVIKKFNSNLTVRMLRLRLKDSIEYYM